MYSLEQKQYFSAELMSWYKRHKRDLPWRRSRNPYHIWVSEIMLQQTRVDTVIPYFERFMDKFPTIEALAEAPEEEVLKAWEGLGYYSRARNLQTAVREVQERYGGTVPDTKEDVFSLKGVGPYTAGAILSIAYNKPEPAVDGNVMRVLSRYFLIEEDIMKGSTRVLMEKLAKELIPEGEAGDFNQALMELGALVCTPKSPHCLTCPVMAHCAGRAAGMEDSLPIKKKAKPPRPESRYTALVEGTGEHTGKVLIRQRPAEGLLARMWELPHTLATGAAGDPAAAHEALASHLAADGLGIDSLHLLMQAEHVFSHIRWDMQVYVCRPEPSPLLSELPELLPSHYRWISREEMEQYAFPNVFLRILNTYFKGTFQLKEKERRSLHSRQSVL
ncbi:MULTISPECIES: A/G-specific adenine glycosylase [Paenibacillus]|uniref:Adenine DNA glycosylase n=1 Tax=Paenibacillus naphthalenovorans TaxID=162209 RepID=A0A0U2VXM9_9BACL|nr:MULTISPECIES: A/G-specific adenine glycosylase [Paenibacillus]ALS24231.1 A/G-specific adenine glycosylase [Paenibacillus naphthalenovorans]GCL73878.1 A/G-specific adenine glycosylase [Paenibacillus naphthalenovorans]SDI50734.1 A/G-specific adenine glycosylase [Paenibacillus naphthalenovorans]